MAPARTCTGAHTSAMGSRCWEWGQTRHRSVSPESRPGLSAHLCPLAWSLVRHETSQTALCTHVDSGQPRISEVWLLLSNVVPKRTVAVKQQARFGRVLTPPAPHPSRGLLQEMRLCLKSHGMPQNFPPTSSFDRPPSLRVLTKSYMFRRLIDKTVDAITPPRIEQRTQSAWPSS